MKVREILVEMAWPDKFDQIESMIRAQNLTLEQLQDYLIKEFDVAVMFQTAPHIAPFHVGSGSISANRITSDDFTEKTPKDIKDQVLGKFVLQVELGPGPNDQTPAAEVTGLIQMLRHEISHMVHHIQDVSKHEELQQQYIPPNKEIFHQQNVEYILQPIERPAQAVDIAAHLVRVGMTPEDFEHAIDSVFQKLKQKTSGYNPMVLTSYIDDALDEFIGPLDYRTLLIQERGLNIPIGQIFVTTGHLAVAKALAHFLKDDRREIRQRYHVFMKLVKKRYPKMKGYYKKHKEKFLQAFQKNAEIRMKLEQQLENLDELLRQVEELG